MNYPGWRQDLVRSLHVCRSKPEAKYMQVASVSPAGLPCLRTMVFRRFLDNSNTLSAVSDCRSDKIKHWQIQPKAELHWYFVKTREQYRLSCDVQILTAQEDAQSESNQALITQAWQQLSKSAQEGFFVPEPKTDKTGNQDGENSVQNISNQQISPHFALCLFSPYEVDYLDLKTTPHTRVLSELYNSSWQSKAVNP
uniref:pyridoxamine 5'-phosphate oxidase family protein n=1 Tax=Ningiella ruwaisensis TaxID=2364274 RepID=UPI00109F5EFE|nr:pyridoxamine 5'-phosphate oxidase family protein [Ningiella ruwaisensis]